MKRKEIKVNLIDRAVRYISPIHAKKRMQARAIMSYADSYIGASKTRRQTLSWDPARGSADSDILTNLSQLRWRSRDLIRNNSLACGAINTNVTNVVGTGLRLQSRIDRDVLGLTSEGADAWESKTEREWRLWAESKDCDVSRTMNFSAIQELAFRQTFENGDAFLLLPRISRKDQPYSLRVQIIEADRVCNKDYEPDNEELAGGIKKNKYGAPLEYHILDKHPGNKYKLKNATWSIVPAFGKNSGLRNVIHLYKVLRAGQTRGVPYLSPVMELLKQLGRYTDAEIEAAVIASAFTVFIKSETGDLLAPMEPVSETGGKISDDDFKLATGAILGLAPGEDVQIANPGRPNSVFDLFFQAIVRQIGVALELPFEILIKHFTASYSAARAALLEAWKFFLARRKWLADNLCQEIYQIWMYEAVSRDRITAPGYFSDPSIRQAYHGAIWVGPSQGQIDPLKEVKAAGERIHYRLSTRAHEAAQMNGLDYEKIHKQLIKEDLMAEELKGNYDITLNSNEEEMKNEID